MAIRQYHANPKQCLPSNLHFSKISPQAGINLVVPGKFAAKEDLASLLGIVPGFNLCRRGSNRIIHDMDEWPSQLSKAIPGLIPHFVEHKHNTLQKLPTLCNF